MRLGIVGDIHAPFSHPMYMDFCKDIFSAWGVNTIHLIGDVVDAHALSFWDHDPNGLSAESEAEAASVEVDEWYRTFLNANVSIGNHDERQYRVARKAGMPDRFIRPYADVWRTPKWDWQFQHEYDGVLLEHGTGTSGKDAAMNRAIQKRISLIMGHVHSYGGVKWHTSERSRVFGMNVGCGIDCDSYAAAYGKAFPIRPTLSCGVLIDGHPYFEIMPCGPGEKYHKSRKPRKVKRYRR